MVFGAPQRLCLAGADTVILGLPRELPLAPLARHRYLSIMNLSDGTGLAVRDVLDSGQTGAAGWSSFSIGAL
jgi:hypothetical protein